MTPKDKQEVSFEYKAQMNSCPFCGSWDLAMADTEDGDDTYVRCCHCGADGPFEHTSLKAIEAWNNRGAPVKDQS
jgi:Lar family restriction alleviation protein